MYVTDFIAAVFVGIRVSKVTSVFTSRKLLYNLYYKLITVKNVSHPLEIYILINL